MVNERDAMKQTDNSSDTADVDNDNHNISSLSADQQSPVTQHMYVTKYLKLYYYLAFF